MIQPTIHEVRTVFGKLLQHKNSSNNNGNPINTISNVGCISIGACVANAHVGKGETIQLKIASRNDSMITIKYVKVKLIELVQYSAEDIQRTVKVTLYEKDNIELPTICKERRKSRAEIKRLVRKRRHKHQQQRGNGGYGDDDMSTMSTYQSMYHELVSNDNNTSNHGNADEATSNHISIDVPDYARDSYSGKLVSISHYLKITFCTNSFTADNPSTKIPIIIGNRCSTAPRHHRSIQQLQQHQHQRQGLQTLDVPIATPLNGHSNRTTTRTARQTTVEDDAASTWDVESIATEVPMVHAVLLDQNSNIVQTTLLNPMSTSSVSAEERTIILESHEVFLEHGQRQDQQDDDASSRRHHRDYIDDYVGNYDGIEVLQPMVEPLDEASSFVGDETARTQLPTIAQLLEEMDAAVNVLQVFLIKEHNPVWVERFQELSSAEFGAIISHASMEYQCRVATTLATHVSRGGTFTCAYCAAAVNHTSEYFRSNMVEALLPFCVDLVSNHHLITNSLSDWEQVLTVRAIEDAIRNQL